MTVEEIEARVEKIRALKDADERAHAEEDRLHQDVLQAIAEVRYIGAAKDIAAAALKTQEIDFSRWYA